jgi:hypothetical protein
VLYYVLPLIAACIVTAVAELRSAHRAGVTRVD